MNLMHYDNYTAKISYDPEIELFRGEILGLNGGADFYGTSVKELRKEFKLSLKAYLDMCKKKGIKPRKRFSGKFNVRIPQDIHEKAVYIASSNNESLNDLVRDAINDYILNNSEKHPGFKL